MTVLDADERISRPQVQERRDLREQPVLEEVLEGDVMVADEVVNAVAVAHEATEQRSSTGTASDASRVKLVWSISKPSPLMQMLVPVIRA